MITSDVEFEEPELAGREAYNAGLQLKHNPYRKGTNPNWAWELGWHRSEHFDKLETAAEEAKAQAEADLKAFQPRWSTQLFRRQGA